MPTARRRSKRSKKKNNYAGQLAVVVFDPSITHPASLQPLS